MKKATMQFKKEQIQQLNRLQRQKQIFQKQLTLQQVQSQLIKDYVMRQGDYKVIITIYQCNDLQPKSLKILNFQLDQKTACDAFVQVNVNSQTKRTQIRKQTNNPIFDEQMFFEFPSMSIQQLDRSTISFNVYDTKFWGKSQSLIGSFQLDWTNVYFKRNHQLYRVWLSLYDPNHQIQGPVGYILANIAVLGPNDQITIHDSAFIKDPLVTIEDTVTSPKLRLIDFSIGIQIYRAENLVPLDSFRSQVKAYVIAKFSGNKVMTSVQKSLNPQWNECIKLGTQVPNKSKYITLEVRNKNYLSQDDIIGVLKIPFVEILDEQEPKPRWGHLYGPPLAGKDIPPTNHATKMQIYGDKVGSHYRGRILYKIIGKKDVSTKNIKNKLIFKFPYRILPVIPTKLYLLRVDLIEAFGLPQLQFCYIHICMGQYTIKTRKYNLQGAYCEFLDMLQQKKMSLPQNVQSLPDLVIYFAKGLNEMDRIGYLRIKPQEIYNSNPLFEQIKVHQIKYDRSINNTELKGVCGYIACRLQLFNPHLSNPARATIHTKLKHKQEYEFRVYLYRGQGFLPANEQGDCDPLIKFSFVDKKLESNAVVSTYNPVWNQVIPCQVTMQNLFTTQMQKLLICDVYDYEKNQRHNYMGSYTVKINGLMKKKLKIRDSNKTIQFIHSKPQWYYVVNPNVEIGNPVSGKVLLSCSIFKKNYLLDEKVVPFQQIQKKHNFDQITTDNFNKDINFFVIGIRQLNVNPAINLLNAFNKQRTLSESIVRTVIRMSSQNNQKIQSRAQYKPIMHKKRKQKKHKILQKKQLQQLSQTTDSSVTSQQLAKVSEQLRLKNCGCQLNTVMTFTDVQIPRHKMLTTHAQFIIADRNCSQVYGYNSVDLKKMKNVFDQGKGQSQGDEIGNKKQGDILDVQKLQKDLNKLKLLNKIRDQIKQQQEDVQQLMQHRPFTAAAKNLIPPSQLQVRNNHYYENKFIQENKKLQQEQQIEMQKIIKQFQEQLLQAKHNHHNQFAYIKYNQESNSNNYAENLYEKMNINQELKNTNGKTNLVNKSDPKYNKSDLRSNQFKQSQILKNNSKFYNQIDHQNKLLQKMSQKSKQSNKGSYLKNLKTQPQNQQEQLIPRSHTPNIHNNPTQSKIPQPNHYQNQENDMNYFDSAKNLKRQDNNLNNRNIFDPYQKTQNIPSQAPQSEFNIVNKPMVSDQEVRQMGHKHPTTRFKQEQKVQKKKKQVISDFDINQSLTLSQKPHPQKVINYEQVQKGLVAQQEHRKQAEIKQQQYKYVNAVKLSLFKWMRKPRTTSEKQTYQDYDTDEEENLDIIPEWYKGRKILKFDLQQYLEKSRTIQIIPVYRGRKIQGVDTRVKQKVGTIKMVVISQNSKQQLQKKAKQYQGLLRPRQFSCRVYVLKGKSLLTKNLQKPNTYLRFSYGNKVTEYKQKTAKQSINPQYFIAHQQWIQLPGPSTIKIQVMRVDKLHKPHVLGYTQIDVQDRYFIKKWHLLEKKPIELRNLYSELGIGTQGRLQTWIDIVQKKKCVIYPVIKISPPPWDQYELRVIVWSTKDCVFKNQQLESNDIYVRGWLGKSNYQQTDVHWACRSIGNFNYRMKFPVYYPPKPEDMYSDVFTVQIWDKDIVGYNNLIGQTRINLNQMHKIIQKAVKRKKPVQAAKKIIEQNMKSTQKFWFDVFNHKQKDQFGQLQSQGLVQLSFELVPMQIAKQQRSNGYGRSQPNIYPTLQQPAGRLNFNFLHPLDFLKQILGPNMYRSLCLKILFILIIAGLILIGIFFGSGIVAAVIAKG